MEADIDIRRYLEVLLSHWRFIAGATLITAVVVLIVSFILPPVYEAKAGLIIARARSQVSFEPRVRTLSEEQLSALRVDTRIRQETLEALVMSPVVAAQVIEKLGDALKPAERRASELLEEGIKVEVSKGELITIKWRDRDPSRAALIANTWAQSYEAYVNGLYGTSSDIPESIQSQLESARTKYDSAQAALGAFIGDNRITELSAEISSRKGSLDYQYTVITQTTELIANAQALLLQANEGGRSGAGAVANGLALVQLQTSALTGAAQAPFELRFSLDEGDQILLNTEAQGKDIETLIGILEDWRDDAYANVRDSSLLQDILQLEEELEREQARERELLQSRDLAWETHTALARKADEVDVAVQTAGSEVKLAVPAIVPHDAVSPRKGVNTVVAGALGFIIGVFGALVMEYRANPRQQMER